MPDTPAPAPATPPAPAPAPSTDNGLTEAVESLIKKFGGEREALDVKTLEGYKDREQKRQLREELDSLKAKFPEGSIVLQREDAATWNALKAIKDALQYGEGKPEAILAMLKEHGELSSFKSESMRTQELQKVVDATGAKLSVLKELGGDLAYDVKEIEGKKVAYVKYKEGDVAKEMEFKAYAKEKWGDFEAALFPADKPGGTQPRPSGGGWVPQTPASTSSNKSGSAVSDFLAKRNAARTGKKEESKA